MTLPGYASSGALSPDGSYIYVLDVDKPQIFSIDLVNSKLKSAVEIGQASTGGRSGHTVVSSSGGIVYATVSDTPQLTMVDTRTVKLKDKVDLSRLYNTVALAISPLGNQIAVGGSAGIALLNPKGKVTSVIPTRSDVVAYSPDGRLIYSGGDGGVGMISVFDVKTEKRITQYRVGKFPTQIVISPDGKTGYTIGQDPGIFAFNTATGKEIAHYESDGFVKDIAMSPDGRFLYVSQLSNDTLYALDAATLTNLGEAPVALDAQAGSIVLSRDGSFLYVLSEYDGTMLSFQTGL